MFMIHGHAVQKTVTNSFGEKIEIPAGMRTKMAVTMEEANRKAAQMHKSMMKEFGNCKTEIINRF